MAEETLKNRVVIVTGGVQGIGKNIALAFARAGARVVVCDLNRKLGAQLIGEWRKKGMDLHFLGCDLSRKGAAAGMVQRVAKKHGRLDVLVNNAHSAKSSVAGVETEKTWDAGMAVTLKAAFFASQAAVDCMASHHGGSIVNVSSISGQLVCHQSPVYQIAKAGMLQMTRYFAVMAGEKKIRVNAVLPGFVVKDQHQDRYADKGNQAYRSVVEACHPLRRPGFSDEVADAVLFLSGGQASFITGQALVVDGGLTLQEQSTLLLKSSGVWRG